MVCNGCGSNRHKVGDCDKTQHPNYNHDHSKEWKDTKQYEQLVKNGKPTWLNFAHRVDGSQIEDGSQMTIRMVIWLSRMNIYLYVPSKR